MSPLLTLVCATLPTLAKHDPTLGMFPWQSSEATYCREFGLDSVLEVWKYCLYCALLFCYFVNQNTPKRLNQGAMYKLIPGHVKCLKWNIRREWHRLNITLMWLKFKFVNLVGLITVDEFITRMQSIKDPSYFKSQWFILPCIILCQLSRWEKLSIGRVTVFRSKRHMSTTI